MAASTVLRLRPPLLLLAALTIFAFAATATASDREAVLLNEIAQASNRSLLWGPYRPNLYFGVKPRIPKSFSSGLLWGNVDDYRSFPLSRCTLPPPVAATRNSDRTYQ